ncbi:MAG TPA: hypothetical protein VN717_10970, partial [Gemmatimonadaceae bacterium]|nr:hypothetical protein [Gemmatimonadaceae bacterium]
IRQSGYPGLSAHEWTVLEALIGLRASTTASLVARVGFLAPEVEQILARFVELDYAMKSGTPGDVSYRALAPMSGQ